MQHRFYKAIESDGKQLKTIAFYSLQLHSIVFKWHRRFVYKVYDLWQHQVIGKTNEQLRVEIPAHGVFMVRLSEIEK
ncbi:hypothetical protein [Roseimarinus sediminis]|uniref:hypothetical protein n=1 Tax=Roseimarinus sediminis TaxID=1610899 RepID=UPI003D1C159C